MLGHPLKASEGSHCTKVPGLLYGAGGVHHCADSPGLGRDKPVGIQERRGGVSSSSPLGLHWRQGR